MVSCLRSCTTGGMVAAAMLVLLGTTRFCASSGQGGGRVTSVAPEIASVPRGFCKDWRCERRWVHWPNVWGAGTSWDRVRADRRR